MIEKMMGPPRHREHGIDPYWIIDWGRQSAFPTNYEAEELFKHMTGA
mgnify:CR=1 FL=1